MLTACCIQCFRTKIETIIENALTFLLGGVRNSFLDSGQIWSVIIFFSFGFLFIFVSGEIFEVITLKIVTHN